MSDIAQGRIALIGFGEVGKTFAQGFLAAGFPVASYDILFDNSEAGSALRARARAMGVDACASAAAAADGARVVISAVTATSAFDVAREAATYLRPGQFFLDINSVSPETKRADAAAVEPSGASYVEAAVMAPVAPYGLKVPMLSGRHGRARSRPAVGAGGHAPGAGRGRDRRGLGDQDVPQRDDQGDRGAWPSNAS